MLETRPEHRPTTEDCLKHPWFEQDREALEQSLFLNKNQGLLADFGIEEEEEGLITESEKVRREDAFVSFLFGPSFYKGGVDVSQ